MFFFWRIINMHEWGGTYGVTKRLRGPTRQKTVVNHESTAHPSIISTAFPVVGTGAKCCSHWAHGKTWAGQQSIAGLKHRGQTTIVCRATPTGNPECQLGNQTRNLLAVRLKPVYSRWQLLKIERLWSGNHNMGYYLITVSYKKQTWSQGANFSKTRHMKPFERHSVKYFEIHNFNPQKLPEDITRPCYFCDMFCGQSDQNLMIFWKLWT